MSPGLFLRYLVRESRGSRGRLTFFVGCLAVGVAAVVAVASLSRSLDSSVRAQAKQLLAADLKIEGRRPLPPELEPVLAAVPGIARTDLLEMVTVVAVAGGAERPLDAAPAASQLVELKVVDGEYPFYGALELEPALPLPRLLAADSAVVAPDLLTRLGMRVGDALKIGDAVFRVSGLVLSEPDRIAFSLTLGPRVFLSAEAFARTGLEAFGSRIEYIALVKTPVLPKGEIEALARRVEAAFPDAGFYEVETAAEGQPGLRRGIDRVERFLGLVALVSLLIGGIGVAQTVRAWLAGRLSAIAVLKCLGLSPAEVTGLYLGQAALLGLVGSTLGALAGLAIALVVPGLVGDLVPPEAIRFWQPAAFFQGIGLGFAIAVLFSVPPLAAIRRLPPVRVLRRSAEPLPPSRVAVVVTALVLAVGVFLAASFQASSFVRGLQFAAGAVTVTLVLTAAAMGLTRTVGRLRRPLGGVWLRHGLAALGRPGAATVGAIVALGLGVMVVLGMALVERHLGRQLQRDLPAESPTVFLIDVQPDQWQGVQEILAGEEASNLDSVPVVMARFSSIDGTPVGELAARRKEEQGGGWAYTRELRLTYLESLPEDNRITAGSLWSDPNAAEVSVEAEFAGQHGITLGTRLALDVQGVPLELVVTSLRTVEWETFRINFFLVVEPGVLDEAPQFRIAAARVPRGGEQILQDRLAAAFPNVTVLRIREVLEKIAAVLGRLGIGVRFLGGFTVLAGLVILGGAVSAGAARRGREVALLKTLGMTRGGVLATFAVEYALIGLVAGAIGAVAGEVLSWAVLTRGMEIPWSFLPLPFAVAILGCAALTAVAGSLASTGALLERPIAVLRAED